MIKPPYKIPSISEINSVPWNGLKVVETFAGGGGSDTGWRWSGYKTVWANEFEKNPCATYRANFPETFLDTRDIKIITAKEILMRCKLRVGELDVFSGSPPCQGFSIANKNRLQRKEKKYDNGIIQKNEDLFFEYIRLLKGLMPKVFVAENVKGLTIGKAKSILGSHELDLFDNQDETILHGLMNCGYVVRWQILNAADYGTPQSRQRVFFIGVRKDLNLEPCFPIMQGYQYSVLDALPWLAGSEINWSDLDGHGTSPEINKDNPAPCVSKRGHKDSGCKTFVKIINGAVGGHSERRGQEISAAKPITTLMAGTGGRCGRGTTQFQIVDGESIRRKRTNKKEIFNSESPIPEILRDSRQFQIIYGCNTTGKPTKPNKEGNSFPRDLIEPVTKPIQSVTKSGSGMGGTSCMIQEGETKRKFTIQELKRLGGFPDDYQISGSYSKQWEIIGNSVCPPQMRAVADCLYENIFVKLRS